MTAGSSMRLCILAPEFLPIWGGVGTYTVELVRHLPKNFEVHVVAPMRKSIGTSKTSTFDYDLSEYFSENVHVHFVSSASDTFFYNAAFQYACMRFVPKLVKDVGIDLIHSHTAHMPDLLLPLRRLRIPTVTTVHTTIQGQRQGSKQSGEHFRNLDLSEKMTYIGYPILRVAEELYFLRKIDYITVSNWMKRQLLAHFSHIRRSNVRVIHNSVDTRFFTPGESEDNRKIVLFTGRLIAAKGLTYLTDAIPQVLEDYPDTLFTFIGPGNPSIYRSRLLRRGVPRKNYIFLGYLKSWKDILTWYRKCAIFVAPTLYENLPIRILEAMACAKPVVATNVCAIPEAVTSHENGILVPSMSSKALAEAICSLLEDPEVRLQLGRAARKKVVEEFDWTANANYTTSFYEEVLNAS